MYCKLCMLYMLYEPSLRPTPLPTSSQNLESKGAEKMLPRKILHTKGLDIKILYPKDLRVKSCHCGRRLIPFLENAGPYCIGRVVHTKLFAHHLALFLITKIFPPSSGRRDTKPLVISVPPCAPLSRLRRYRLGNCTFITIQAEGNQLNRDNRVSPDNANRRYRRDDDNIEAGYR
jgi:hypothetical protein